MEQQPNYIKGFNDGYKLAKYQPELYEKLRDSLSEGNEYERGVLEGSREFEKEKDKEKGRMEELNSLRESKDKAKDMEIEK